MWRTLERATSILIENDISKKMIFIRDTPNMPTDMPFFITNKDPFISSETTLDSMFWRNEREVLTAPDTEV